jgi:hypothetical protein
MAVVLTKVTLPNDDNGSNLLSRFCPQRLPFDAFGRRWMTITLFHEVGMNVDKTSDS